MKKLTGGEKIYIKYIIICLYYYKLSAAKTSRAADDEEESRGWNHVVMNVMMRKDLSLEVS